MKTDNEVMFIEPATVTVTQTANPDYQFNDSRFLRIQAESFCATVVSEVSTISPFLINFARLLKRAQTLNGDIC